MQKKQWDTKKIKHKTALVRGSAALCCGDMTMYCGNPKRITVGHNLFTFLVCGI